MAIVASILNALESERLKYLHRARATRNPYTEGIEVGIFLAQGIVEKETKQEGVKDAHLFGNAVPPPLPEPLAHSVLGVKG